MHSIFVEAGAKGMAVGGAMLAANFPSDSLDFLTAQNSLELRRFDKLDMLVVSKLRPGFDRDCVDNLSLLLRKIASGVLSKLKYLVFDFAHRGDDQSHPVDGFDDLVSATSELILSAPVITIAWARSFMSGADLDFALVCSGMVAEREARFSFETDLVSSIGLYSSLARKIGWVKTERTHGSRLGSRCRRNDGSLAHKESRRQKHGSDWHRAICWPMQSPLQRVLQHLSRAAHRHAASNSSAMLSWNEGVPWTRVTSLNGARR